MIHCIGNSHANFFTDTHPGTVDKWNTKGFFSSMSIGPVIAYNFIDNHLDKLIEAIDSIGNLKKSDKILLVVGEVDCRWHLPAQIHLQKRDMEDVVDECVERFFEVTKFLVASGLNPIGWGGHPTTTTEHDENPRQPIFGCCEDRNDISRRWNHKLEELCLNDNIPFVSIVDSLINEENLTKMEYYRDYCHLDSIKLLPEVTELFKKRFPCQI